MAELAGRSYVPRLYKTSGRGDLVAALHEAVGLSGARLIYTSEAESPRKAPLYLGIATADGSQFGVLVYPFRATKNVIRNRPTDENRVQVRLGSEKSWRQKHRLARDVAGVDATLVLGIDPKRDLFVGLNPAAYDPLPMGISVEFKDARVSAMKRSGWEVWDRNNVSGVQRQSPRGADGVETMVLFRPERLVDYVRFEHEAASFGLDASLRYAAAKLVGSKPGRNPRHDLEKLFGLSAHEVLDIISGRFRLLVATKGGVAEHHLEKALNADTKVVSVEGIDEDGRPDFEVVLRPSRSVRETLLIECKNVGPEVYKNGDPKVEVQKTRSQKHDPAGRLYKFDQFDLVAVCMFAITGRWEFKYCRADRLTPHKEHTDRIAATQRVDDRWESDLLSAWRAR